jgi:pantetheine-phosphate adenylyltransferase
MESETDLKVKFLLNPIAKRIFDSPGRTFDELVQKWNEPWRFFHTIDNHLRPMLEKIHALPDDDDKHLLEIAAWFHDCVYDPKRSDNEVKSIGYFRSQMIRRTERTDKIVKIIRSTIDYKNLESDLEMEFAKLDTASLSTTSVKTLLQNEKLLLKEFQFVDYSVYKERRIDFLKNIKRTPLTGLWAASIINAYIQTTRPRIAIYPGSFDPFHIGHLSVLKEAEKSFDKVIVAIGINPQKKRSISPPASLDILENILPYHQVEYFSTFLHKYAEKKAKDADVTIIRGFRSGYDIDAELINLAFMRDMCKDLKVIFIAPQKSFDHVSSSAIRQIQPFDPSECDKYLPEVYYPES